MSFRGASVVSASPDFSLSWLLAEAKHSEWIQVSKVNILASEHVTPKRI